MTYKSSTLAECQVSLPTVIFTLRHNLSFEFPSETDSGVVIPKIKELTRCFFVRACYFSGSLALCNQVTATRKGRKLEQQRLTSA